MSALCEGFILKPSRWLWLRMAIFGGAGSGTASWLPCPLLLSEEPCQSTVSRALNGSERAGHQVVGELLVGDSGEPVVSSLKPIRARAGVTEHLKWAGRSVAACAPRGRLDDDRAVPANEPHSLIVSARSSEALHLLLLSPDVEHVHDGRRGHTQELGRNSYYLNI
jgi:hypothetical protein